jgi:asparagine synthase (glutamine-hydrolysing)
MGGFIGCARMDADRAIPLLARMLEAPSIAGRHARRASLAPLCTFGARDAELAEDDEGALALAGYAHDGRTPLAAADLLARWRAHGREILASLSGEFALAVRSGGTVSLARDRHGTRPLYVGSLERGELAFATSIGPLIAAGASAEPDVDALVQSLALGYVPAPRTALVGVQQLGPGELWTIGRSTAVRLYFAVRERLDRRRSLAGAARQLDRAITQAVARALPARGRVGAFLSGGIDSSLVLARLREVGADVEAFTLHFGDRLPGELRYARSVAEHLGVRHHVLTLDERRFCDAIEPSLLHLEDLLSEPIAVPNFLLAQEAARHADVLFTGEGGDPPFGGPKNIGLVLAHMYRQGPLAPSLAEAYLTAHHHLADDLDVALTEEARARFDRARFERDLIVPHVDPERQPRGTTFVGGLMAANVTLKGGSNILVKVAKMVGAHDLALRSPLFDPAVVELAMTIPPWQKLQATEEKLVMKRAAARSLPRIVLERPKRGMAVPLAAWFRGHLGVLARDVLTERAVHARGLFRWSYVERLLRGETQPTDLARSRTPDKLWLVLVTELHQRALARLVHAARAHG